jgi:integrase/recombinase XerD
MEAADISGIHACPKGLRHHFGLMAISAGVPLSLLQRWMGHAKVETTMLYLEMMDAEERGFAERMWRSQPAEARA